MSKHKTGFCPICLQAFSQAATLDCCHHQYCLQCIREWSKTKTVCPICQKQFKHIRKASRGSTREEGKRGRKKRDDRTENTLERTRVSETGMGEEEDKMEEQIFQILTGRETRQGSHLFLDLFTRLQTIVSDW